MEFGWGLGGVWEEPTHDVTIIVFAGIRQGYLFKRKKQCDEWNSRWFVLSADFLTYYKSYQVS